MIPAVVSSSPFIGLHQAVKFVAAAYAVVLVIILVYVAIMAVRAQRIERDLAQLQQDVEAARAQGAGDPAAAQPALAPERTRSLL